MPIDLTPERFQALFAERLSPSVQASFAAFGQTHALQAPIFLIGLNRSGTSLFTRLLAKTDAIVNWSEANDMWDPIGYPWEADKVPRAFWPFEPQRYTDQLLEDSGGADGSYYRAIPGICAAYVHMHGGAGVRARFLNKSPMNTLRIDVLQRLFPDACFVSLVRDPRAVVRSWAEKNIPKLSNHPRSSVRTEEGRQVLTVDGQPYERPHFLSRLCESYVYVVNTQLRRMKAVPPERKYEARYEEFVADIHGTLRRLDEHFGLDSALRRWTDIPRRQENRNSKFRREFNDGERRLVSERCGPLLRSLGYLESAADES